MTNQNENPEPSKSRGFVFVVVFMMLCALTALSFWISRSHLMNDPVQGWSAMMAVSLAKSALVAGFFMHLWWEKSWKYVLTIPALIMGAVLALLLVPDIGYRVEEYSQDRANAAAEHDPESANSGFGFYNAQD